MKLVNFGDSHHDSLVSPYRGEHLILNARVAIEKYHDDLFFWRIMRNIYGQRYVDDTCFESHHVSDQVMRGLRAHLR